MNLRYLALPIAALLFACTETETPATAEAPTPAPAEAPFQLAYPASDTVEQVDDLHGTQVADPYRWLEADVRESEAVANWVEAQNEVTFGYLDTIPERAAIRERLRELWNYERFSLPERRGGRYFYDHNDGLKNQDVVYVQEGLEGEPRLLIDPNEWSEDGTVALASFFPSPDGRHLAYLVQDGGSDWRVASVLDVDTGAELDDRLDWLKFTTLSWAADGSGFYYSRFPEVAEEEKFTSLNKNMTVNFHRLGTPQEDDTLVYARPDQPEWLMFAQATDDGRHLVITIQVGTDERHSIVHKDLTDPAAEPTMIIEGFEHDYTLVDSIVGELFFRSNNAAPRNRLIAIDPAKPDPANWREIIPEANDVLDQVTLVGGRFVAEYMQDARSVVKLFETDGSEAGTVALPAIGSTAGFDGDVDDPETFFRFTSFNTPPTINRLDVSTGEVEVFKAPQVDFDPLDYVVRQVFYTSKDGTRVPMFIVHHRDVEPDGNRPTLLYGYGGFNISLQPAYSTVRLAWMEMGGIYASANLRGGGEYGEEWHQAGTRLNKQNVFDDFIAAADYLIAEGYTKPSRLAIFGGSNGGLLVGAVLNQRPDLFGAALPAVGVMDMLRFHLFTAGRYWTDDYGSPDNPEEFAALYAYSPYHNIRQGGSYPPVMVTTADTDDRVVPGHSFKYAAALQAAQAGEAPVLIRIETRAGHGAGSPTDMLIDAYADRWGFLVENLNMELPAGYGQPQP
jgi:prolyl oligopeptidase